MRRRSLLRAAALGLTLPGITGCSRIAADVLGRRHAVSVAVTWSGAELAAFHSVLDQLPGSESNDFAVHPISLGDTDLALASQEGQRPDIVLLSRLGSAIDHRDELEVIPPRLRDAIDSTLWSTVLPERIAEYVLPFKAAFKSAIWFDPDVVQLPGTTWTWQQWVSELDRLRSAHLAGDGPAPLALAASDAWTLTDLFENILLGLDKDLYAELLTGRNRWNSEQVIRTLELVGRLLTPTGTFAGGVRRARVLQFPDAVQDVFLRRDAAMVVAPDFADAFVPRRAEPDWALFPVPEGSVNPRPTAVIGGDLAVLPNICGWNGADNPMHLPAPVRLLEQLVHENAPLPWIRDVGGFLPANPNVEPDSYPRTHRRFYRTVFAPERALDMAFDLSDVETVVAGTEGLWTQLQRFLDRVGERDLSVRQVRTYGQEVAGNLDRLYRWHRRDLARRPRPSRRRCG